MDKLLFIVTTLGLGILCSVPGIILGMILVNRRMIHEVLAMWLVGMSTGGLFFIRLMLPQLPLELLVILVIVGSPLAMYRADLWEYFLEGELSKNNE